MRADAYAYRGQVQLEGIWDRLARLNYRHLQVHTRYHYQCYCSMSCHIFITFRFLVRFVCVQMLSTWLSAAKYHLPGGQNCLLPGFLIPHTVQCVFQSVRIQCILSYFLAFMPISPPYCFWFWLRKACWEPFCSWHFSIGSIWRLQFGDFKGEEWPNLRNSGQHWALCLSFAWRNIWVDIHTNLWVLISSLNSQVWFLVPGWTELRIVLSSAFLGLFWRSPPVSICLLSAVFPCTHFISTSRSIIFFHLMLSPTLAYFLWNGSCHLAFVYCGYKWTL